MSWDRETFSVYNVSILMHVTSFKVTNIIVKKNIYIYILNFHVLMTCNFNFWISFFDLNAKICDSCNRWIIVWQCLFNIISNL